MISTYILNLEQFERGVDRWEQEKVPEAVRNEHKRIALMVLQGCVMGTPVKTGNARGGWDVVERPSSRLTGRTDQVGAETVRAGSTAIQSILSGRMSEYTVIYVQNNVHYIGVLENTHHSPQNSGWVKATVVAVQAGLR